MKCCFQSFVFLCSLLGLLSGCGKQGDPLTPIVPKPLPVKAVSAKVSDKGIVLSWSPPTEYDTQKILELDDIKYFSIYRTSEPPVDDGWDFKQSDQGWTTTGENPTPKCDKGVLRAVSAQRLLTLLSPADLKLKADQNRIIHLKLWAKNARYGYLVFITEKDTLWDKNFNQEFEPSVHSSFYAVHQTFHRSKSKRFSIRQNESAAAQDYIIDMRSLPSWAGTVRQIGLILENNAPEETQVELGLDSIVFMRDIDAPAPAYTTAPWIFQDDEEGWQVFPADHLFGAAHGVLHAEGNEFFSLLSAPGQRIHFDTASEVHIRMRVTAGHEAYLILRRAGETPFQSAEELKNLTSQAIRIPLKHSSDFLTYSIDLRRYMTQRHASHHSLQKKEDNGLHDPVISDGTASQGEKSKPQAYFVQVGLAFPPVASGTGTRHISIDYIDIVPEGAASSQAALQLVQQDMPSTQTISRAINRACREKRSAFTRPYESLPETAEQSAGNRILLAKISPSDPFPAVFADETFELTDSGDFIAEDEEDVKAPLEYGRRYRYEIEVTDRKKRNSKNTGTVEIELMRKPSAPRHIMADAGDEEITISWEAPVLTEDGKKIQHLAAYRIFRSDTAGEYAAALTEVPASQTHFIDKNVTNHETYYYVVQSLASRTSGPDSVRSAEVSAVPLDTIAPDVPQGLVGVYLNGHVDLHWNQVLTADFVGFNVYRSNRQAGEFRKVNDEILPNASFSDKQIESGQRYYYYVTALDDEVPPNESDPSEIESIETDPLD
ncbi:hypothetical protein CSB45_06070 [candidate division KSB3 bacterium]|uniref:Fibronectin type-III domain-containing protein n=1 Tax=candidate division KSB3 bacterium TaxID=2044937 RepID=A0A2G6E6T6_9BACT|nr:MAG: hypothetical protein CSB45_06070 [candidate division KSB3 bacterium]PIE30214.1 MAG: hypothetical protein CSA57_04785 [candidate division KSB3 bacterium]